VYIMFRRRQRRETYSESLIPSIFSARTSAWEYTSTRVVYESNVTDFTSPVPVITYTSSVYYLNSAQNVTQKLYFIFYIYSKRYYWLILMRVRTVLLVSQSCYTRSLRIIPNLESVVLRRLQNSQLYNQVHYTYKPPRYPLSTVVCSCPKSESWLYWTASVLSAHDKFNFIEHGISTSRICETMRTEILDFSIAIWIHLTSVR